MATSGTTDFNMDFTEIAEEAWERAGRELRSGYDLRTARRSMNLMTIEWQNRGINLWTIDEGVINLVAGTGQYSLPDDTIDLLEQVIRTGAGNAATQSDLTITRISVSTYASIPNKLSQGRPIQVWIERLLMRLELISGLYLILMTMCSNTIDFAESKTLVAGCRLRI